MRKKIGRELRRKGGMEMVQVAILVAIAIVLGLIFKTEITAFINKTFEALNGGLYKRFHHHFRHGKKPDSRGFCRLWV